MMIPRSIIQVYVYKTPSENYNIEETCSSERGKKGGRSTKKQQMDRLEASALPSDCYFS